MGRVISDLPSFSETVANGDLLVCHNVSKTSNKDEKLTVEKLLADGMGTIGVPLVRVSSAVSGDTTLVNLGPTTGQTLDAGFSIVFNTGASAGSTAKIAALCENATGGTRQSGLAFSTDLQTGGVGLREIMRISGGGRVGIGTATPGARLEVSQSGAEATALFRHDGDFGVGFIGGPVGSMRNMLSLRSNSSVAVHVNSQNSARLALGVSTTTGSTVEHMTIISTGLVGIGTPSPTEELHVVGDVLASSLTGTGNRAVYSTGTGVLTNSSSDARMKTDVEEIGAGDALAMVDALRPVRYRWGAEYAETRGEQVEVGLIAQEVLAHVPEVIGENGDGMLSVDYPRLTALLIGAVQALTARVAALEGAG